MLEKINTTVEFIKQRTDIEPQIGLILGSGLNNISDLISSPVIISYEEIPNFPKATVKGHKGNLIFGYLENKPVVAMQGRFHYYEGYSMEQVIFPIRTMAFLGINTLIVTNACGGLDPDFEVSDIMIIKDHINLMPNPLIGEHEKRLGDRFPDMSKAYDKNLIEKIEDITAENHIQIQKGVYVGVTGPTLETPAEYKYLRIIGGDAVGMSTTPEIIAAHQMKIKCLGISVITDLGIEGKIVEISHEDVLKAASKSSLSLQLIIKRLIQQI